MVGLEIEWHWTEVCIDLLVLTCVTPRCRRRSIRGKPTPVVSNFLIYGAVCRCNVYGEKTTLRYHRYCTATLAEENTACMEKLEEVMALFAFPNKAASPVAHLLEATQRQKTVRVATHAPTYMHTCARTHARTHAHACCDHTRTHPHCMPPRDFTTFFFVF